MDLKNYKAGTFHNRFGYRSFHPESINREWKVSSPDIHSLLEEANARLGELNAFSALLPEFSTFLRMHVAKEATLSSRIEGTRTTLDEAVLELKDIEPEKRDDWQEVQNYMEAMNHCIKRLEKLPLSGRLMREAHKILLKGVRGKNKSPGEFRSSQNWIGGVTLKDARFIPPHHSLVTELMGDLEKFLNNKEIHVPHLVRIGMAHYQFEAIHPFLDGNGRIGRLLITLYLMDQEVLKRPILYISDFIEQHRNQYYSNLSAVSERSEMEPWLRFFLTGIIETAKKATSTLTEIRELSHELQNLIHQELGRRAPNGHSLLKLLFAQPVVSAGMIMEKLDVSKQTAHTLIQDFERLNILIEKTGFKRNRVFLFEQYLHLFEKPGI